MFSKISEYISSLRDLCFPLTCVCCDDFVETPGLCADCWTKIRWISNPKCSICGMPFELNVCSVCAKCSASKPKFDKAVSVCVYDEFSKGMILKFKNGDATYLAYQFAAWMYRVAQVEIDSSDIIVPVPIYFWKRMRRKYNQAEELAREISKLSCVEYDPDVLVKTRSTLPQEGLSRAQRLKNLLRAFAVTQDVRGKKILIVDDVLTTGSTINECAKVLKKAGASEVRAVTIARVQ